MGGHEVRYLLDTGMWLMSALRAQVLPTDIRKIIGDPEETLGLSIFSLWEAAKKHQQGKLALPMDLPAWLKAALPSQSSFCPSARRSSWNPHDCRSSRSTTQRINSSWRPPASTNSRS